MSNVLELYTLPTQQHHDWLAVIARQYCAYLERKCLKARKSEPDITIGACTVLFGRRSPRPVIICPFRLLERHQVFMDSVHLLTLHEPGNELHVVQQVPIPGGAVDYFIVSARDRKIRDFVGLEIQALDTTGTIWPERQRFLSEQGIQNSGSPGRGFGVNWKMTAKTTLLQLHHKTQTFELLGKHLVLAVQDCFLDYVRHSFKFDHLNRARLGDAMHIHAYTLNQTGTGDFRLSLSDRLSTDANGVAACLGLQASPHVDLEDLMRTLEEKISDDTLLRLQMR